MMKQKPRLFFTEEHPVIAELYSNELYFNERQTLVRAVQGAKILFQQAASFQTFRNLVLIFN